MKKNYISLVIITIIFSIVSGALYVFILNNCGTTRLDPTTSKSFETKREQYLEDGEIDDVEGYALIGEGIADLGTSALGMVAVGLIAVLIMILIPFFTVIVILILSIIVGILQIGNESPKKIKASRIMFFICLIVQIINIICYAISVPILFNIEQFIISYISIILINFAYTILSIILNSKKTNNNEIA